MKTILLAFVISLASSHVNCGPIKMHQTRVKRAIFDLIPSAENRVDKDNPGSSCQCSNGTFSCIRDENLVCRRTFNSLETHLDDEHLQVVDHLERKTRRKGRQHT